MKLRNTFFSLILCLLVVSIASAGPDDRWKSLLMKNFLKGWTFDVLDGSAPEDIYSIEKGILSIQGKDKSTAVICTKKEYSDYELKWEWRWPDKPGSSGCLIHCSTPREMNV